MLQVVTLLVLHQNKSQILKSFFQYFLIFGTSLKVDRAFVGINKHTKKPVAVKGLCQFQGADRDAVKAALGMVN